MALSDLPDPNSPSTQAILRKLELFQGAYLRSQHAYRSFIEAAHNFDFVAAGEFQLKASANLESAMDEYLSGCRIQKSITEAGDGA